MASIMQLPFLLGLCFLGSFCGLIGGVILLLRKDLAKKLSRFFVSFAVGALLGSALFDLLPEAMKLSQFALIYVLAGIITFSITERTLVWHNHNHHHEHHEPFMNTKAAVYVPLLLVGDTLHNFIDGVIIGATYLFNASLGIVTTLAVFFHEMPQEIGDFGVMLHAGYPHGKIFWYNVFSASATFVGGISVFVISSLANIQLYPLIAFAAGGFVYIATADLMPELKHEASKLSSVVVQTLIMALGITVMVALSMFLGV